MRRANNLGAGHWSIPDERSKVWQNHQAGSLTQDAVEFGFVCGIIGLIDVYDAITRNKDKKMIIYFTLINYGAKYISVEPRVTGVP